MKRVLFTLICASLLFVSCGGKSNLEKPKVTGTVEMYVAVVDGQDQFVKTTVEYTGNDGSSKTINIDGLSFSTTMPDCLSINESLQFALSNGAKVKYAKVATETGNTCSMKAVFKFTATVTPTEPIDFMAITGLRASPKEYSKLDVHNLNIYAGGLKADRVEDYLNRHSGDSASCTIGF